MPHLSTDVGIGALKAKERLEKEQRDREAEMKKKENSKRGSLTKTQPGTPPSAGRRAEMVYTNRPAAVGSTTHRGRLSAWACGQTPEKLDAVILSIPGFSIWGRARTLCGRF